MNTYARTTDAAFGTHQSIPILGLWSGDEPTTLQHSAANKQASVSTVALATLLLTMLGSVAFASYEPPTFADTAKIVTPPRFIERKNLPLSGYEIQSQSAVNEYLNQHMTSRDFLREVAIIIDGIYGSKVICEIHVVEDVDTGKPIMELTIKSGLPLDDDFDQKDQLLFQRLDASGLASGLRDVVISQG